MSLSLPRQQTVLKWRQVISYPLGRPLAQYRRRTMGLSQWATRDDRKQVLEAVATALSFAELIGAVAE